MSVSAARSPGGPGGSGGHGSGQLLFEKQENAGVVDGSTLEVQYGFLGDEGDNFSRIGSITYPNGEVVTYNHDAIGRVTGAQSESYGGKPVETLSYLGLSTTIGRTLGDGVADRAMTLDFFISSAIHRRPATLLCVAFPLIPAPVHADPRADEDEFYDAIQIPRA